MIIKRHLIGKSMYKKLTVFFLLIFLVVFIGCADTRPRATMACDPRTGVYYEQVEKLTMRYHSYMPGGSPKQNTPPGSLFYGYIVSTVGSGFLGSYDLWVVPPPGYKWVNPSDGNDMRIVPSNLSK